MNSIKKLARVAGLLYLMVAVSAGFGFFVRMRLVVAGDALSTVSNIRTSEALFRAGFVSDLVTMTCFVFLPLALYRLLQRVNRNHALLMVVLALVSVPMMGINMINQFAAVVLLSGSGYLEAFEADQLHSLVMLFLDLYNYGYLIVQIFFGLWLLPLGWLVFKSGFIPRILGVLLIIANFVYLAGSLSGFLFPSLEGIVATLYIEAGVAEILLCLWLLVGGVDSSRLADYERAQ